MDEPAPDSPLERLRRRPHHLALASLVAGLLLAAQPAEAVLAAAAAVAVALAAWGAPRTAIAGAALLVGGAVLGALRIPDDRELPPGTLVSGRAELLEAPRQARFGDQVTLRIAEGPLTGARVLARSGRERALPRSAGAGTEVFVSGLVSRPRAPPAGGFDYAAYLRRRGVVAQVSAGRLEPTGRRRGGLAGALDAMRRRAERATSAGLASERAALVRGMVLGQDERIQPLVRDDFRGSGLGHLLAVSGQNVMLLAALALPLLAAAGLGHGPRALVLLGLIVLYVPLAGAGPSLQRAGVMGAAALVATLAARPASRWYALLLAAAATLALNPLAAGDAGWQLSFAAVAGILLLGPALRRPLAGLPRWAAEGLAMTVAATVATAPLLAHHFGAIPVAGLPANLLALPAVAPVMWIGLVETALGQAAALGPPFEPAVLAACRGLGALNGLLLAYLERVARACAELPGAQAPVRLGSPLAVSCAYAALAAVALLGRRARDVLAPRAGPLLDRVRAAPAARRRAAAAPALAAICLLFGHLLAGPGPPDRLTVSFLDVGQGDATLVQDGRGAAVLFDGGPAEARVVRLLRRAGVRRLAAVVATHGSADHHGGLAEVLRRMPVDLMLDGGDGTRDPAFNAMLREAARRGVRRVPARAGQELRIGSLKIRILSPPPRGPGPPPEDPNPRAVVATVSSGWFDLLLSADAESPALAPLALPDVDAMKVPHHGSADPGLAELLRRVRPEVAAAEVGEANSYGHPAESTLAALRAAGAVVYRTDRDGTVRVSPTQRGLDVLTER